MKAYCSIVSQPFVIFLFIGKEGFLPDPSDKLLALGAIFAVENEVVVGIATTRHLREVERCDSYFGGKYGGG